MIHHRARRLQFEPIQPDAGTSFFTCKFPPRRFVFWWHQHPELEIGLIMKGRGRRYVGDSMEEFGDGDLVLIGADLPHSWHSDRDDGTSAVIQFLPSVFGDALHETPELRPIAALLRRSDRGLRLNGRLRDEAERLFWRILDDRAGSWRRVTELIALLGTVAESSEVTELSSAPARARADESSRQVDQVFARLHGPPDEIPSQADAALALKMSPAAFSRFFKRSVGKTYVACVNETRILAACRDLIETDRPVIDIAYAAGFENLSNFNRRFRALKGTTPRDYRAQRRRAEQPAS